VQRGDRLGGAAFDDVTVAEIANAANVSVKTLFAYFRSKEDLVFTDTWLIDAILAAMKDRRRAPRTPTPWPGC
jgi:AcrR family transcriptional regulator